ncbi:MAG: TIGR02453 family protein [Gemmatimonadota bacterium]
MAAYAPAYRVADPHKALSRPNRDTRFSKDKRPYRTEISVVLLRGGRPKHEVAGFFFSIAPAGVDVLGGAYMPGAPQLAALRRFLSREVRRFQEVVEKVEETRLVGALQGERLKRVPAGYPAEGPAADLVRYKRLYFRAPVEPTPAAASALAKELNRRFRAMTPFVELLDEALAAA